MPTVLHRLARWADDTPDAPAQRYKVKGAWTTITAREFRDRVYYLALFLESRGVKPSDFGCILGPNSPAWVHLDLAVMLLGAKSAGLYPNSTLKDIAYIIDHTEARLLAVAGRDYYRKVEQGPLSAEARKRLELVICFDEDTSICPGAVGYQQALDEGRRLAGQPGARPLRDYLSAIDPNAEAFIIYTSGTTGNPKGALLSHDNLIFTADMVSQYWKLPFGGEVLFSFLPLCHIAEKIHSIGVGIHQRYRVDFCTKFDNVSVELPEVQPTLLLSVPRLWEKMMEGVLNKLKRATPARKKLAMWALDVGARVAEAKYSGRTANPLDLAQYVVADRLVLSKVRTALGLGQAKILASGAAALPSHVSRWFRCLGLEILEDYGQTESTGVICMTEPGVESAGTVGKPVPGMEVKIAEDGEILTRGRHVFKRYHKDPAATAATLENGWLHTGDLGELTPRGLIRVRGRKKEVLKTSGGKMVAPLPIEETLKASPLISQACMVGDGRKYLSVLLTLPEAVLAELKARQGASDALVVDDPKIVGEIKKTIDALNKTLASYEQIKRFAVLSKEFSIADGEMTPTLKMKRMVIEDRYKDLIASFYPTTASDS